MTTKFYSFIAFISILFIFSACQKELSFINANTGGTSTGTAVYTFSGAPGNCTTPLIRGTFQAGVLLDTTHSIAAQVTVTTPGTYTITSSSANGITFAATGTFTVTGLQTIIFKASGTPIAGGPFDFTLGTGGCKFSVTCTGGTTPPVNNTNCKTCIYVPMCAGIKFSFYDTTSGMASIRTVDLLSSVDTTIDAKIYQKITATSGVSFYNCTNGETNVVAYQQVSNNGNVLQKYQATLIKANAAIGTTWTDNITNPFGQTVVQNFKIESKPNSRNVGTFSFNDIIVVSLETGVDFPGVGFIPASFSYYYYAKGIGLVEVITQDPFGQGFYHSVVKSYFIP